MTRKIVPTVSTTSSTDSVNQELLQTPNNSGNILDKKPVALEGWFSLRVVIILMIIALLVTCSVLIWLASFIGSNQTFTELSNSLISQVGNKIIVYLKGEISPISGLAKTIAEDFNSGVIGRRALNYLWTKNEIYRFSGFGVYFPNEFYSYTNLTYFKNGVSNQQFIMYYKPEGMIGVEVWYANETDGSKVSIFSNQTTPFIVSQRDYYVTSMKYFDLYQRDGVYGDTYIVTNSTSVMYYSAKLFDPVLYAANKTKSVVGISKVNISLLSIERFLSSLKLLGNGYVLVSESSGMVIGGSINTTALNKISRVSLFELTDRNAGILMKDIANKYGALSNTPDSFQINSMGVDYLIYRMNFELENLSWNVYMVIYMEDVTKTSTINTGISIAIATVVIFIGLLMSIVIGYLITHPLRYLKNQFMKIKKFDLDKMSFTSSRFKEIDSIYEDLHDMVAWLNEFKNFLPEAIFNQLRNMEEEEQNIIDPRKSNTLHESNSKIAVHNEQHTMVGLSSHGFSFSSRNGSSLINKKLDPHGNLFKLGLIEKEVSVVTIRIVDMFKSVTVSEISHVFAKIANGLSVVSKQEKPNLAAMDASLKIAKTLESALKNFGKAYICIGIATGKTNIGNLGTNQMRVYSIVGPLIENSKKLASLCHARKCHILADSNSVCAEGKSAFVVRPVERLLIENETFHGSVSSIYEVMKENNFERDEWMYELEQQKTNSRFKDFEAAFSIFEDRNLSSMSGSIILERIMESQKILTTHLEKHPEDAESTNRILNILKVLNDKSKYEGHHLGTALLSYHTMMKKSFDEILILSNESLHLSSVAID
ncbi:hypothetical protein FDP41_002212 [Naegleria fowleri]|uniref:Guanylate cyclase domain-containing protein n=1 Tax=Naegleria fowleri TaxID=5763 RepID=A0A6A5BWW6_NAEFO|nr:uncharacterized protein FDP41_002212 [Naegleria fowleri]KAF0979142.1 hypothetical protein FDP41_002212 [Naegleria fowleri]